MRAGPGLVAALVASLMASVSLARADEAARRMVERAIQVQGGEAALARLMSATTTSKSRSLSIRWARSRMICYSPGREARAEDGRSMSSVCETTQ